MITNRKNQRIVDLIDGLPGTDKTGVAQALDGLNSGIWSPLNPQHIQFDKYKIRVGDVEIIFEYDLASGDITIVDIKQRKGVLDILRKIGEAIDISPTTK